MAAQVVEGHQVALTAIAGVGVMLGWHVLSGRRKVKPMKLLLLVITLVCLAYLSAPFVHPLIDQWDQPRRSSHGNREQ